MSIIANLIVAEALSIKFSKKVEECYAVSAMAFMLVLYSTGLYFSLTAGMIVFVAGVVVSFFYIGFHIVREKRKCVKSIFTCGFVLLLVFIIFFAIYSMGRGIDHSDDFYFWNLRIKNFVYYDKIRNIPNTAMGNHPPFVSLWDCLAVMTWRGTVSQGICLWAQNVLMASFLIPVSAHIKGKGRWIKTFLTGFIIFYIPTMIEDTYHTLLNDFMLGVIFFYCLFSFFQFVKANFILDAIGFVLGSVTLIMTKRTGPVFYAFAIVICCCACEAVYKKRLRNTIFAAVVLPSIVALTWYGFDFSFLITVCGAVVGLIGGVVLHNARGKAKELPYIVVMLVSVVSLGASFFYVKNYCEDSIEYLQYVIEVIKEDSCMRPSFLEAMLVIVFLGAVYLECRRKYTENKISQGIDLLMAWEIYTVCLIAYLIFIWYLMITQIGPANGGFGGLNVRYFIPLLIPAYGMSLYAGLKSREENVFILLIAMSLLMRAYTNNATTYNLTHKASDLKFLEFEKNNITLTENDRVYLIDEYDGYGYTDRAFYNYIFPAKSQFGQSYNYLTSGSGSAMSESLEQLEVEIEGGGYNYVYIQLVSEESAERYASLFEMQEDIGDGRLYSVEKTETGIKLKWLQHD